MEAKCTRAIFRYREGRRQPRHALPSVGSMQRKGTRKPWTRRPHSGGCRESGLVAASARTALAEIQHRVTRQLRAPQIPDLDGALCAADASVCSRVGRTVRSQAFVIALISCALSAGVVAATPHFGLAHPPQASSVTSRAARPSSGTVPSSSGPRHNAVKQPPVDDGPLPGAAPQTRDGQSEPAAPPRPDLSLDVQGLSAGRDDPDLEAALNDLDKQADLDELMRRPPEADQPPPLTPDAGPSPAPPFAQPSNPLPPAP